MYDVYGVQCATYEEACRVAGIETPDQIEDDEAFYAMLDEIGRLREPVVVQFCRCLIPDWKLAWFETAAPYDEIPF